MAKERNKLGWGNESDIKAAVKANKLDGGDLVITKDTKRLAFIDIHNEDIIHFVKSRMIVFDSLEDAKNYASSDKSAYAGELISVLINGKQKTYRLQPIGSGFEIEDINSDTKLKQYVQVVDSFPETDQEEGVIYISGNTGKVWNGSDWKVVFEDINPIKEELNKKAPLENPEFTGVITVDGNEVALKSYVEQMITALPPIAPEKVDTENPLPQTDYKAGQSWYVAVEGTYAEQSCNKGDLIICVNDFNEAFSADDFIVVQKNSSDTIVGTDSSTDGEIVIFSGVSGKAIKNSGINIDVLEDLIAKSHEHTNKEILDTFTMTQDELLSHLNENVTGVATEAANTATQKYLESTLSIVDF